MGKFKSKLEWRQPQGRKRGTRNRANKIDRELLAFEKSHWHSFCPEIHEHRKGNDVAPEVYKNVAATIKKRKLWKLVLRSLIC